jgi:hypothetical protein
MENAMKSGMLILTVLFAGSLQGQPGRDEIRNGSITRAEYDAASAARFERLDANGDGVLTRDEARGRIEENLAAIDTDGDRAWSLAELQAVRPELSAERFARMDSDGNGLITIDERFERRRRPRFSR